MGVEQAAAEPVDLADATEVTGTISDAQHGTRGGGTLHTNAVAAGAAGFMTGTDKTKLDGIEAGAAAPGGSDGELQRRNGTQQAGISGFIGASDHIEIGGGTMPALGAFRLGQAMAQTFLAQKKSDGTADIVGLAVDNANAICLGGPVALTAGNCFANVKVGVSAASGAFQVAHAGSTSFYVQGGLVQSALPRVGFVSPYASEGSMAQAMADADQTPAATVYSRRQIRCTGALTANRNLTLPTPANEDATYRKIIRNETTGVFAIVVKTAVGGSTTAAIPVGMQAEVVVRPGTPGVSLVAAAIAF